MRRLRLFTGSLAMLAIGLLAAAGAVRFEARAQDAGTAKSGTAALDEMVARVNGVEIRMSDVQAAIEILPPQYRNLPPETLFKGVIEQLIDRQLVVGTARAAKMEADPVVKAMMARVEGQVLEQVYMRKLIERKVNDRVLRRHYERERKNLGGERKVHARHILVKTRKEAEDAIKALGKGAEFAELASKTSIGPSKAQGGDLGFFARSQMVAPFANAAFQMAKGEVSRAPVKTRFGWHVIKVEDIKEGGPPPFGEVKESLQSKLEDKVVADELARLRKAAKIERVGAAAAAAPKPAKK